MSTFIYTRVSTESQEFDSQIEVLTAHIEKQSLKVDEIFSEKISSMKDQSELKKLLLLVNPGDQIFVTELSRLARNLSTLVQIGNELRIKGVNLHSLKENINTTTPTGVFIYQIFSCFYEFERNLISERTKRSLEFRRARGFKGGRPKKDISIVKRSISLYKEGKLSIREILRINSISRATLYRYIREEKLSEKLKEEKKD